MSATTFQGMTQAAYRAGFQLRWSVTYVGNDTPRNDASSGSACRIFTRSTCDVLAARRNVIIMYVLAGSGLTLGNVFADNALVALQLPGPVRTVLKPLGDARLRVNLAFH